MTEQPTPTPSPLCPDDVREQHRRTLRYLISVASCLALDPEAVAELRRVTDAEQAECDGARRLADEWQANALTTADRCDEQARRTRKARQQRDEARERATKADALGASVAASLRQRLDQTRANLTAERDDAENLRRLLAVALGEHPAVPWERLVERAAEMRQQLSESEKNAHRLLQRAEKAEARADALARKLDAAHRRADAANSLRWSLDQAHGQPPTLTVTGADPMHVAQLNARVEVAAAHQAREQAEHDRDRRRRQVANRLGVPEDTSWPDLLGEIGTVTYNRQQAVQRAAMLERSREHWKAKAREIEADRDRLAAELATGAADVAKGADAGVRAVQGWMAADVAAALGHDVHPAAEHGGHKSWSDWWANLMGEVHSRRVTAAELEQAKATHNARRVELARALGQRMDLHWESLFGLARSLRHGNADLKARNARLETAARRVIDLCGDQGSDVQDTLRAALDDRDAERCCVCSSPKVGYHNYQDKPFCWPCADAKAGKVCGTYQPPTKSEDSGYCADCGMNDWKHGRG